MFSNGFWEEELLVLGIHMSKGCFFPFPFCFFPATTLYCTPIRMPKKPFLRQKASPCQIKQHIREGKTPKMGPILSVRASFSFLSFFFASSFLPSCYWHAHLWVQDMAWPKGTIPPPLRKKAKNKTFWRQLQWVPLSNVCIRKCLSYALCLGTVCTMRYLFFDTWQFDHF